MESLGPAAYDLKYRRRKPQKISVENQLLMTLIKLRLHTPNTELAFLFNVSEFTVGNIFVTWVNCMHCSWIKLDIWPSREHVDSYMPVVKSLCVTPVLFEVHVLPVRQCIQYNIMTVVYRCLNQQPPAYI